jgi:transcriptional regulator with XRE-family HTH domain
MLDAGEQRGFASLLRQHRLAAGLTQESLAERTGLGTRTIQGLEGGEARPRRATIERLAPPESAVPGRSVGAPEPDEAAYTAAWARWPAMTAAQAVAYALALERGRPTAT